MLGDLPSPIMEEPSQMGTAPTSPQTPRPHPSAERSLEAKAARHLAQALHHSRFSFVIIIIIIIITQYLANIFS